MPFTFRPLAIPDVVLVTARIFPDERGAFLETYQRSAFVAHGITLPFVQDNHSRSVQGVLRGLHFQRPPHAQGKLVRAVVGEIFDVAVDLRRGSPTYGRWVAEVLSAEGGTMLYIPPGFAHGFYTLSPVAEVHYKATAEYAPAAEGGIIWDDPDLAIPWPAGAVRLSPKDAVLPRLREVEAGFVYMPAAEARAAPGALRGDAAAEAAGGWEVAEAAAGREVE